MKGSSLFTRVRTVIPDVFCMRMHRETCNVCVDIAVLKNSADFFVSLRFMIALVYFLFSMRLNVEFAKCVVSIENPKQHTHKTSLCEDAIPAV